MKKLKYGDDYVEIPNKEPDYDFDLMLGKSDLDETQEIIIDQIKNGEKEDGEDRKD